jgi:hypothetical protein
MTFHKRSIPCAANPWRKSDSTFSGARFGDESTSGVVDPRVS